MTRSRSPSDERDALRSALVAAIRRRLHDVDLSEKEVARRLHAPAVNDARRAARATLSRHEDTLLSHIADGHEVVPEQIRPRLVLVESRAQAELFRYATLHWSIPVSSGYGRRLRYLIEDAQNGKLIGVIGLGDPVFGLRDRDAWIGWTRERRTRYLRYVMDAFVLGAVPPYTFLLGGKLVAALATSREIQSAFWRRYGRSRSLISDTVQSHRLALLTTTSAYGRSSIYNRVQLGGRRLWVRVGETSGHGEFLISDRLYRRLLTFVSARAQPTARSKRFGRQGEGWRNRREVLRKAIGLLGLPYSLHVHGIHRGIYVAPLGTTSREWLAGSVRHARIASEPASEIAAAAVARWVVPRGQRDESWRSWSREAWRLWRSSERQRDLRRSS